MIRSHRHSIEPISGEAEKLRPGRDYRGSCDALATTLKPISGEVDYDTPLGNHDIHGGSSLDTRVLPRCDHTGEHCCCCTTNACDNDHVVYL